VANIYLLAYYCHPDDRGFGSALICKIVVVLGMTLAWAQVLMLPLDVSNQTGFGGGIDMKLFWFIVYIATAGMVLFVIPAISLYYEADEDWSFCQKLKYSFCYLIATIIITIAILIVLYVFIGTAYIPVRTVNCSVANIQLSTDTTFQTSMNTHNCITSTTEFSIQVSFPIYIIALTSFVSWFLFVLFGGIGLAALPLDLIYDFTSRPKKLSSSQVESQRKRILNDGQVLKELANEAKSLEEAGAKERSIFSKDRRKYNDVMRKLRAGTHILDKQYQAVLIQNELNDQWV